MPQAQNVFSKNDIIFQQHCLYVKV